MKVFKKLTAMLLATVLVLNTTMATFSMENVVVLKNEIIGEIVETDDINLEADNDTNLDSDALYGLASELKDDTKNVNDTNDKNVTKNANDTNDENVTKNNIEGSTNNRNNATNEADAENDIENETNIENNVDTEPEEDATDSEDVVNDKNANDTIDDDTSNDKIENSKTYVDSEVANDSKNSIDDSEGSTNDKTDIENDTTKNSDIDSDETIVFKNKESDTNKSNDTENGVDGTNTNETNIENISNNDSISETSANDIINKETNANDNINDNANTENETTKNMTTETKNIISTISEIVEENNIISIEENSTIATNSEIIDIDIIDENIASYSELNNKLLGDATYTYITGSGTSADPYVISNLEGLKEFRDTVNAGTTFSGNFIELQSDIVLDGDFIPIGVKDTNTANNYS